MELRVELTLSISNKMAIPLVVPAEYGPLPANNNNNNNGQQQQQVVAQAQQQRRIRGPILDRNNNNNHVLNLNQRNQNQGPDLRNHDIVEQRNPLGFLAQLVMELWTVFSGEQPRRPRLESPRNRDNQRPGPRLEHRAQSLPDVVQCHGLVIDLAIGTGRVLPAQHNQPMLQYAYNNQLPNNRVLSPLTHDLDEDEEGWSIGVKVSLGPYREIGQDLQGVADQFEFESSLRRRASSRRRSLEFRVMMKVALPTVALIGLGLSYIRRHL